MGVVCAPADLRPDACFYTVQTETLDLFDDEAGPQSVEGRLLLSARFPTAVEPVVLAQPGDRISITGRFQALPAVKVPGAFDYGRFLQNHGIEILMYASSDRLENWGPSRFHVLIRWGTQLETALRQIYERHLPPREAALLSGLVLGTRPRFHPEMADFFRDSGTMHVLVASGSNVAFVHLLWFIVVRFLFGLRRKTALVSSLPLVWVYVLLVGVDPPIVRAAVMSTVGTLAYAIVREDRPYHALALAALAILIPSPRTLFDVGFQMSFLTVFGLLYYLELWSKWPLRPLLVSFTAHLWLFPITAAIFRKMAPIAPIANLVVVPLSAGAFVASFLVPVFPKAVALYLKLILVVVEFFAKYPGWTIWLFPPTGLWLSGYFLFCFSLPHLWRSNIGRAAGILGLILMGTGFLPQKKTENLTITCVDAGRHTWTLVRAPDEKPIIVFPAEPSAEQRERLLMPFMMEKRIRRWEERVIGKTEPLLIHDILFFRGLSLKKQDQLMGKRVRVMVGRFSARMLWREEFIGKIRPRVLIETGHDSERSPSVSPWPRLKPIVPQKTGWWEWSRK